MRRQCGGGTAHSSQRDHPNLAVEIERHKPVRYRACPGTWPRSDTARPFWKLIDSIKLQRAGSGNQYVDNFFFVPQKG